MRLALHLLITLNLLGQVQRPPGFVRGVVTENTAAELAILTPAGVLYRYRTDGKTWIERDNERIRAAAILPGETLEVVSDRDSERIRYARMIHVLAKAVPRRRPLSAGLYRLDPSQPDPGKVFTGIVVRLDALRLVLRTRFDGEKTIYFQSDTRFLDDGDIVDSSRLCSNTHVYIVAAQNSARELEAYQVIWGNILIPLQER